MTLFYLKFLGVFLISGLIYKYMEHVQKRKEEKAEKVFQRTLKMIEMRNNIYTEKSNDNLQS